MSISSTFYAHFFHTKVLRTAFFYLHVTREKLLKRLSFEKCTRKTLIKLTPGWFTGTSWDRRECNNEWNNSNEHGNSWLPNRCQFYQHFTRKFFVWNCIFGAKILYQSASRSFAIFGTKILYEKSVRKTLMKLMAGVNFTNILLVPFLYKSVLHCYYLITIWLCNFWVKEYHCKSCL